MIATYGGPQRLFFILGRITLGQEPPVWAYDVLLSEGPAGVHDWSRGSPKDGSYRVVFRLSLQLIVICGDILT